MPRPKQPSTLFEAFESLRGKTFREVEADQELVKNLLRLYRYLYDPQACAGCPAQYPVMFEKVIQGEKLLTMKTECSFQLKKNHSFQLEFGSQVIIQDNTLTDELALRALAINPNRIAHFEVFPENWREMIAQVEPQPEEPATEEQATPEEQPAKPRRPRKK